MGLEKKPYKPFGDEIIGQGKNKPKGEGGWTKKEGNEYFDTLSETGQNKKNTE